jgi:hypothetical protein
VYLDDETRDQVLREIHHVAIVAVGLVRLDHGELGVVARVDVLVPEVLGDLEDPFEAADHEPFQIEFGRYPEEEGLVQIVVERREGAGVRPAVAGLERGGLELEEAPVGEVGPDRRDDPAPRAECLADTLVHHEVEVALPVALLRVLETVELLGQIDERLAEQDHVVDPEGELSDPGPERSAHDADDVSAVDLVDEPGESIVAEIVLPDVELDPPGPIAEVGEDGLAVVPDRVQAPREAELLVRRLMADVIEALAHSLHGRRPVERVGVAGHAAGAEGLGLLAPDGVEGVVLVQLCHAWSGAPVHARRAIRAGMPYSVPPGR